MTSVVDCGVLHAASRETVLHEFVDLPPDVSHPDEMLVVPQAVMGADGQHGRQHGSRTHQDEQQPNHRERPAGLRQAHGEHRGTAVEHHERSDEKEHAHRANQWVDARAQEVLHTVLRERRRVRVVFHSYSNLTEGAYPAVCMRG